MINFMVNFNVTYAYLDNNSNVEPHCMIVCSPYNLVHIRIPSKTDM